MCLMTSTSSAEHCPSSRGLCAERGASRRRTVVAIVVMTLQVGTGIDVITVYAPDIFASVLGGASEADRLLNTVFVGIAFIACTPLAVFLVDCLGRRPLLLSGSFGMTATLLVLAVKPMLPDGHVTDVLCVAMVLLFVGCFSFSWGPLAWVVPSELVHSHMRAHVLSVATICNWIADYLVVSTWLSLNGFLGQGGAFMVYAAINAAAFAFCFICVPETKGCHLDQHETATSSNSLLDMRTGCDCECTTRAAAS
eukprot:gnl/TRDRNA2_/TRDRNA2_175188_c1_seq1.p1 gnl/TRDRNA2_/TRDRNA2_175188_c1~~gnl/TRDRNA2_/TRDRNA2_175188_c1_seq1.p1  ORF type:complete len:253 (-),score=23.44 gnl/TRDRNA2_/TRDRNA2_175188_c1_seq1:51-809(-)